jgi:hypothetical protein
MVPAASVGESRCSPAGAQAREFTADTSAPFALRAEPEPEVTPSSSHIQIPGRSAVCPLSRQDNENLLMQLLTRFNADYHKIL